LHDTTIAQIAITMLAAFKKVNNCFFIIFAYWFLIGVLLIWNIKKPDPRFNFYATAMQAAQYRGLILRYCKMKRADLRKLVEANL
jgi:hypothetical protein